MFVNPLKLNHIAVKHQVTERELVMCSSEAFGDMEKHNINQAHSVKVIFVVD